MNFLKMSCDNCKFNINYRPKNVGRYFPCGLFCIRSVFEKNGSYYDIFNYQGQINTVSVVDFNTKEQKVVPVKEIKSYRYVKEKEVLAAITLGLLPR